MESLPGAQGGEAAALPELPRGQLYTYRVVDDGDGPRLDLGFRLRSRPGLVDLGTAQVGQVVRTLADRRAGRAPYRAEVSSASPDETYTYLSRCRRVIDGDTLAVTLDVGFGIEVLETIRLRGIDAPEMPTERGVEAREFVVAALGRAPRVAVSTRYPDHYGRWLGDVWYLEGSRDGRKIAARGQLLNRDLVAAGLAARYHADRRSR